MIFVKAIVLTEREFEALMFYFFEKFEEEKGITVDDALEKRKTTSELMNFLANEFDKLLKEENVEEAVIFVKDEVHEVSTGTYFAQIVADYYKFFD